MQPTSPALEIVTNLPFLPARPADSNKGQFGRILVVAGSRGMTGAAVLCGSAALRGGGGLVKVAVPQSLLPIVAAGNPCYMTIPLPEDAEGRLALSAQDDLLAHARSHDVVALGPGLARSPAMTPLLGALLERTECTMVLDADGLNAFAGHATRLRRAAPLILTPHPGEFGRLLGIETAQVQANRRELASRFAREHSVIVLLKGRHTVITDGRRLYENTTGNPGMATAGAGDVLTGLIAALLGQKLEPFAAAQLGAHVHGLAGDLARSELGEAGLIATDLLDRLPHALRGVTGSPR
jgi:NAD(P)H-hydrate epimerase